MYINEQNLRTIATTICQSAGATITDAQLVAEHLVEANLLGHDSHGVGMLPIYIRNINKGLLKPDADLRQVSESDFLLLLDGQSGFGQVVGTRAMEMGIARAKLAGFCVLGLRNAHHLGRIGSYGEQAASAGLISIHFVNVVGHTPLVAPFGGASGRMNTNPFCCAIPIANGLPLILDMATSTIALGKARVAHNSGESVPPGCLLDAEGHPSCDPGVMFNSPIGALTYIGEHKGFGLALVCELLAGALVGHWTAQDEHPRPQSVINHMFTVIIDPARFGNVNEFRQEALGLIRYLKKTDPAPGVNSVLMPGEPEQAIKQLRLETGIPIDPVTWRQLHGAALAAGLSEADCASIGLVTDTA